MKYEHWACCSEGSAYDDLRNSHPKIKIIFIIYSLVVFFLSLVNAMKLMGSSVVLDTIDFNSVGKNGSLILLLWSTDSHIDLQRHKGE